MRNLKGKALANLVSEGNYFVVHGHLLPVSLSRGGGRARECSVASLLRSLVLFMRALPLQTNHLPKAPPPNTAILDIRF